MTRITSLVMKGFKSFAKYTELEFSEKFNCVIGPNGSGKSNVLDALCFVLGKSSTKSLRAEKSANLIYNGGKSRKPAKDAEVSIWFDNSTNEFPTDDEEVKISRIVRQSGNSVYKINDQTRTRQEIIDLLSLAKIDPNGYNIILQGDIVRFVNMSANERRELIEEIAGIGVYEERKNKAINDLEKVRTKIEQAHIILGEKQSYLRELEKERKQAIKYNSIKERLKINKATFYTRELNAKTSLLDEFQEKYDDLNRNLKATNEKIAEQKEKLSHERSALAAINTEIEEKSEKEQVSLSKDIEDLKVELATAKTRVENNKNELAKLEMRKEQLMHAKQDVDEKIQSSKKRKKELKDNYESVSSDLTEVESSIATFRKQNNLDSAAEYEQQITTLDHDIDELQNQINNLRQTQQELTRRKDFFEMKIGSYDEQITRFSEIESEHKEQITQLKNNKTAFKQKTLDLNDALSRDTKYAAELGQKKSELSLCNQEVEKLQTKYNAAMEVLLRDTALKTVNEYKKEHQGIYGTISELAEVDEEYSLAIEIAAGNKLKGVVVEDDHVAVDAIKHLRNTKSGVATFFPRTKMRPRTADPKVAELTKKEGVIGLATNLLTYDPKFENIFSFIFGNTLVVRSIDDAKRLGAGSAKMVTLSGDLLEKSGSLQGGFRQKKARGTFSHKQLKEQIEEEELHRSKLQAEIDDLISSRESNEEKIDELRTQKAELEGEIIKLEKSLHLDATDTDTLKKQKQDTTKQLATLDGELDEFTEKIMSINRSLADKKSSKQQIREKINEVRNPKIIAQLNAFEESRKDLSRKQMQLDLDIKNVDIQIDTMHKPEQEKNASQLSSVKEERKEIQDEIKTLQESIASTTKILKQRESEQSEFHKKYKGLFSKRQSVSDSIDVIDTQIDTHNERLRKIEIQMNSLMLQRDQYKTEIEQLKEHVAQYTGIEIDTEKPDAQVKREITQQEKYLEEFGDVNLKAIEMYETIKKEYDDLMNKIERLKSEKDDVHAMIAEIEDRKKELFVQTFNIVNAHFKKFFSTLSTKGDAYLITENEEDPFAAGVLIKVRLKGQKYIDIRSLSGGEKTMTALAFIFAIQEYEPASFIIMDEVDAALDKKNSEMLSRLINSYTDRAQFIVISHNEVVITEANVLYGVSMNEHGASKITTLSLEEGKEQLREQENQTTPETP